MPINGFSICPTNGIQLNARVAPAGSLASSAIAKPPTMNDALITAMALVRSTRNGRQSTTAASAPVAASSDSCRMTMTILDSSTQATKEKKRMNTRSPGAASVVANSARPAI